MKIQPLGDKVLIETLHQEKTKGGIYLPATAKGDQPQEGNVVAVGAGRVSAEGKLIPLTVKRGDTVLFKKGYSVEEIKIEGKDCVLISESDILGILK